MTTRSRRAVVGTAGALLVAVVALVAVGLALLAANPDIRAAGDVVVDGAAASVISTQSDGSVRVPCVGPGQAPTTARVTLVVRNDGALPVALGEVAALVGVDGPVAAVGYRRADGEPQVSANIGPGSAIDIVLTMTVARCGPAHNRTTTSTIRQVTLPVRSLGLASSVVVELPAPISVPGEVDITADNPFGC